MGTFHQGKGDLHGITVVVDTTGPEVWIGRCDEVAAHGVVLDDADVHRDGDGGKTKDAFIARAAQVGHWPRHPRVVVPTGAVASISKLGDRSS